MTFAHLLVFVVRVHIGVHSNHEPLQSLFNLNKEKSLEAFAWPAVVLIVALVFIGVFRQHIGRFLDRTKSVGKDGVRAYDEGQSTPVKPDALEQFLEGYQSPLLREVDTEIESLLTARGLINPPDKVKALLKLSAGAIIWAHFEKLYNTIFSSQVSALIYLNGNSPASRDTLRGFYDEAAQRHPALYENRTFEEWLEFLFSHVLIRQDKEELSITIRGREFLKWRLDDGRGGPYFG